MTAKKKNKSPGQWDPVYAHIGNRIKARRLELGMTMQTLANESNLSYQQIQKFESAKDRIHIDKLWQLLLVLDVDLLYFFKDYHPGAAKKHSSTREQVPVSWINLHT